MILSSVHLARSLPSPFALRPAGRPQVTVRLTLRDYITYYDAACGSGGGGGAAAADALVGAPFYLNGWAALASHPEEVGADCPPPYFSELLDHSDLILEQLDKQFFSKKPTTAAAPAIPAAAAASSSAWWKRLSVGLSKLFLGPAGTVTRLHYDAGERPRSPMTLPAAASAGETPPKGSINH